MKLTQLVEVSRELNAGGHSVEVVRECQSAIIEHLRLPRRHNRFWMVVLWTGWAFLFLLALVTGGLAVASAAKLYTVDDKALSRLWETFFGSGTGLVGTLATAAWRRREG